MLLDGGRVVDIGQPASIARQYNQINFASLRSRPALESREEEDPERSRIAQVRSAWFESPPGQRATSSYQGDRLEVRMDIEFLADVDDPVISFSLQSENGQYVFVASTDTSQVVTGHFAAGTIAAVRLQFQNQLGPGRYQLFATIARYGTGADVFDAHVSSSIIVLANRPGGGMVDLPHEFQIERR
jgi:hypothetical protein